MGYQGMLLKTKLKSIESIQKLLNLNHMDIYIDICGYYIKDKQKQNPKIYLVFAGDRHPAGDFVRKLGAKPIEEMLQLLSQKIWAEYDYVSLLSN